MAFMSSGRCASGAGAGSRLARSGFGLIAQSFVNGQDQFAQAFFGNTPDTYYVGCCGGGANCLWSTPSRWAYADISTCAKSAHGAYLTFDVTAAGYAVVVSNPQGRGPQAQALAAAA